MYMPTGTHRATIDQRRLLARRGLTSISRTAGDRAASPEARRRRRTRRAAGRRNAIAPSARCASAWRTRPIQTERTAPSSRYVSSLAALGDVERVEHDEHVEQSGHDQERIPVLVGDGDDATSACRDGLGDEIGDADAEVRE